MEQKSREYEVITAEYRKKKPDNVFTESGKIILAGAFS